MPQKTRIVLKGKSERSVITESGVVLKVPSNWSLLPPGDAALTRSVKKTGPSWQIRIKKGRRFFSGGVWALEETINKAKNTLKQKRSTPEYARKRAYTLKRRNEKQDEYVCSFHEKTLEFLAFHPKYKNLAQKMAKAVTEHATPIGSGTVARTQLVPLEKRVNAAVFAWMRHKTTAYDQMKIKKIKGQRRKVRRSLAGISENLLNRYRAGDISDIETCPLQNALQ